jgi:hypothetical protein
VVACDFFEQIFFSRDIQAMAGHINDPAIGGVFGCETKPLQYALHDCVLYARA